MTQPIACIHVSERGRFGATRLSAEEEGVEALGHVVDNASLGQAIWGRMATLPAIQLIAPATVTELLPRQGGCEVRITRADGAIDHLTPTLTILADGGQSGLSERLGFMPEQQDYGQTAIISVLGLSRPHAGQAWERFTPDGPMALLPMTHDRAALIWTLPPPAAERILTLSTDAFLTEAQAAFGQRAGQFVRAGTRHHHVLTSRWLDEQVRPGLVVLGNAAHTLHPVAGQGFNLTLRDIARLSRHLEHPAACWADPAALRRYEQSCHQDQRHVMTACDGLIRGFGSRLPLIYGARPLGLIGLTLAGPARHWLARRAMGLDTLENTPHVN